MKYFFAAICIFSTQVLANEAIVDCIATDVTHIKGSAVDTESDFVKNNLQRNYRFVRPNENTIGIIWNYNQDNEDIFYFESLGDNWPANNDYALQDIIRDMYLKVDTNLFTKGGDATLVASGLRFTSVWFFKCAI